MGAPRPHRASVLEIFRKPASGRREERDYIDGEQLASRPVCGDIPTAATARDRLKASLAFVRGFGAGGPAPLPIVLQMSDREASAKTRTDEPCLPHRSFAGFHWPNHVAGSKTGD